MNYSYNPYYQQSQQQQNSGFVPVQNIQEALVYPIAPGHSITFKDENAPYIYTKTMGLSQLDRPLFEKYKLVKEEVNENPEAVKESALDEIKSDIDRIWEAIDELKKPKKAVAKNE